MSNFNKIILVGRLTRDPDIKYLQDGTQVTKFSIAVDRAYQKDKNNKVTDFFNIVTWNKLAEISGQYLKKGNLTLIEGEMQIRHYEKQDGTKGIAPEVQASSMKMLGSRNDEQVQGQPQSQQQTQNKYKTEEFTIEELDVDEFDAGDMPF